MTTWIFAEERDGVLHPGALELATKARGFGDVNAFLVGEGSEASFAALGAHGVTAVHHLATGDALPSAPAASCMADRVMGEASLVLFGPGNTDRDVAGRLGARIDRPVVSNALDVSVGTSVVVRSEILGGTIAVDTEVTAPAPALVVTRPKAFVAEPGGGANPSVVSVPMPDTGRSGSASVGGHHVEASEGPALESAPVIVSGGRGLGSADKFAMLDELAGLLGAAVGGTRAVVDAGWVPYSYQVGQTGKTVKPSVYLACGISGAMQHVVGMKGSGTIIAINKDPDAPIFSIADLGVVGDVHKVVPQLIEALKARG
jgi:electron transfer flavoprotein alpha subunit